MVKILKKEQLVPNIHLMILESDVIHLNAKPGEFIVVRPDETGERIPLNLVDWDKNSVSVVFMEVGTSTRKLGCLKTGDSIADLAGPLGRPTEMVNGKKILCIGGCYGIGAIYPVIRAFKENNNRVITAIEARSSFLLYWQERLKEYSDELYEITRDGTKGFAGHIDKFLNEFVKGNNIDMVYAQGCTFLTYLVSQTTKPWGIKTIVGLNPIMIDATGMCGVCRVIINGETKFACVDGPEFDGHTVDWQNLLTRRHIYINEERKSLSFYECEKYG
jgi:ferredoxin--NADP+ reductase|uniref:Sulfide/dihydroorotate dehydrogenase-like FAD/NAD-binding protein n=1 Tax=candidate division WOR-3 bacterium TaxID=2052148 RepID=A0A7C4XFK8_UNCW3